MSRIEHPPVVFLQFGTRCHEIGQISIRRRHQRAGPAHDVIRGETGVIPAKADVVTNMAGGVNHAQRPVVAGDGLSVT